MTGKLIRWKPDESNNLKELWSKVVQPLSKSQLETQSETVNKQIFYTCLQIFVQASGAYTELVEPALITGNDDKKSSLVLRTSFLHIFACPLLLRFDLDSSFLYNFYFSRKLHNN